MDEPSDIRPSRELAADVRTVAKGGAVQIAGQIAERGLSFLLNAIAFRLLGRAPYGVYRQVVQILMVSGQVGLAGFNYAAMRFIAVARASGEHGRVRGAARTGVAGSSIASAAVVVILLVLGEPIAGVFADSEADVSTLARLVRLSAPYVPLFALLQVLRYCTQAYKTMVPSVIAGNIVQPVVRFVLGVAVLIAGLQVSGLMVSLWVSVAGAAVAAGIFLFRMMTAEERAAPVQAPVGPMVRFALPQGGSNLLGIQSLGLGILVLGAFGSDAEVGLFAAALMLQGPGTVFLGGILHIWAPVVSDLHSRGEIGRLETLYQTINRWIATFAMPVWAALIVMPDPFVALFGGSEARGAETAVAVLALGNLFYTSTGPTGYVLSMTGRPGINFVNSIVGVALYVGAGAYVVPRYGLIGMAWVDAAVTALINAVRVVEAKVLVGVQPFGRTFFKPAVAALAGAALLGGWRFVPLDSVWTDVAGICVAAIVYLIALRLLGIDPEERMVWDRIRKRLFRRARS